MRPLHTIALAGLFVAAGLMPAAALDISGAGATFPYPIYAKWADAYKKQTGIGLNYQSIGSGGGIKQIQNNTVTFGASDMPLTLDQLNKDGLIQFPTVIGGDVPVANLEGVKPGELKLDGVTLAKIFLGEIKAWNDPAILKLNPNAKLPSQPIVVVHRSDGSGTTFIWTDYLSKVSADWKSKVGANTSVEWPAGIGAKGNEGVANNVQNTKGSIGYVEYAYAKQNKLTTLEHDQQGWQNRRAEFRRVPSCGRQREMGQSGWLSCDPHRSARRRLVADCRRHVHPHPQAAEGSGRCGRGAQVLRWAYANGDKMAEELDYVPMPKNVVAEIEKVWATEIKDASGKPIYAMAH